MTEAGSAGHASAGHALRAARRSASTTGPFRPATSVDLAVHAGEIHGLLGENGAGKSTLMKVLLGLVQRDEGDGAARRRRRSSIADPQDAVGLGLGMVHQHFSLIDALTVWENVVLGDTGDRQATRRAARCVEVGAALRPADRPAGARRLAVGGRAATRRGHQVPAPRSAHPDPGRADVRAHPGRIARVVQRAAAGGAGRGTRGDPDQPQARRDHRGHRHDHRAAPRRGGVPQRTAQTIDRRNSRGRWSGATCRCAPRRAALGLAARCSRRHRPRRSRGGARVPVPALRLQRPRRRDAGSDLLDWLVQSRRRAGGDRRAVRRRGQRPGNARRGAVRARRLTSGSIEIDGAARSTCAASRGAAPPAGSASSRRTATAAASCST